MEYFLGEINMTASLAGELNRGEFASGLDRVQAVNLAAQFYLTVQNYVRRLFWSHLCLVCD